MVKKALVILIILVLALAAAWQLGAGEYLLARFVFAPDREITEEDPGKDIYFAEKIEPLEYEVTRVAQGLEIPWEIVPLPDGRLLVTERPGRVTILGQGTIATIHDVRHIGEGGLMGAELDPDFEENGFLYLYYSYQEDSRVFNRVSRFVLEGDNLRDEEILLEKIPGDRFHNGGRIRFGPDGALYITTGDASKPDLAQDLDSLAGKILRLNPDGTIPQDNPFPDSPVYSYGHRNPQGIAWDQEKGRLYSSEHGPVRQDKVNLILPGKNYGWPLVECGEGETEFEDPLICYTEFTLAPSGMDFYPGEGDHRDQLFIAGLRGNMVMRISLDEEGIPLEEEPILTDWGRLRTVRYHQGVFYVATNDRDGRGTPGETSDLILKVEFKD